MLRETHSPSFSNDFCAIKDLISFLGISSRPIVATFSPLSMTVKFLWQNTTQVYFGEGAVKEHLSKYISPGSKVICTFGGGSIDSNGARSDVQSVLDSLHCTTLWQGGICPNPEYDHLLTIVATVKSERPDLLLAVGGGSVCDATKFIAAAASLDPGNDPWDTIMKKKAFPSTVYPIGAVMTLPATGSEWNSVFVVSRRATREKLGCFDPTVFPKFSLLDPRYTMTLPLRQLRNGVFDALIHCIDRYVTPQLSPMFDDFYLSVVKELLEIGPQIVQPGASVALHERLIVAALFAINGFFSLTKPNDRGTHIIGHLLTAKYGIDHAATLSIVTKPFLENQLKHKTPIMARSAEFLFGATGTADEKARLFVEKIGQFAKDLGLPSKVSDWEGAVVSPGDVDDLVTMIFATTGGKPFGAGGCVTEADTRAILEQVVV
jgi:alcohol dehydrogenase YqhD (iron-dependent ADH family)